MFILGAFAIIWDIEHRVLLCHRRDFDAWNLPGGRVESGELPTEAVVREVREETGLEVVIERLVGIYGKADNRDELVFAFVCRVIGGVLHATEESSACEYFDLAHLPPTTLPKHVERIHDALEVAHPPVFRRQTAPSLRPPVSTSR